MGFELSVMGFAESTMGVAEGGAAVAEGGVAFEELAGKVVALPRELPAARQWQAEQKNTRLRFLNKFGMTASALGGASRCYSHSMVLGGLLEMSKHTRLTPLTSLMMRVESRAIKS